MRFNLFMYCTVGRRGELEEAERHGHDVRPGDEAGWGGILVVAKTDAEAHAPTRAMLRFEGMPAGSG